MKYFLQVISLLIISVCSFSQDNLDRWTKQTYYYVQRGEYAKAIPYADSTAEDAKQKLGKDHWQYALFLDYLAQLYTTIAEYAKAEAILFEAAGILKKSRGIDHADYLRVADNLVMVYQFRGQFSKAEIILLQINKVYKGKQGEQGTDYAKNLDNLARLYERKFEYSKAQLFYEESLAIREKIFGVNNESYALSLINIGNNLTNMLLYDRAEELFIQASKIYKNILGEMSINYASSLDYLGGLYMTKRVIEKAEPLFIKAKEIHKKISGESSLYYANSLNKLGALYLTIGNYDKAEPLLTQAADIRLKKSGPYSSDYAISLDNLANLFRIRKDYDKAEKYYKLASAIKVKQFGRKHLSYTTSLNYLGIVAYLKEQYAEAEALYWEAIEIIQGLHGEKHPEYAGYINNLSLVYSRQKKYDKAEKELLKAKTIYKNLYGEEYPIYITTQYNLGSLYIQTKQYPLAELVITDATQASISQLQKTFSILSEKEKESYLGSSTAAVSATNSLLYQNRNASPAFYSVSFDQQLFFKSFLVTDTRTILETISRSKDMAIKKLFEKWQNNRIILSKQYSLPAPGRISYIDSIRTEAEAQEKELIQKSPELKNQKKKLSVNTQNVYDNLASEEAAIEFVNVTVYHNGNEEKQMYIAYILTRAQPTPIFVPLCEEKQMQKLLDSTGKSATSTAKVFYRGLDIKDRNTKQGAALYKLIWQPLESYMKGVKKIFYSPAGKLYGIAFHALPIDSTTLLMDKYQLRQYTSTRQVASRAFESQIAKPTSIALFGDANFSMDSTQLIKQRKSQAENNASTSVYTPATRSSNNSSWPSLPGTAEEVDKIKRLFTENKIANHSFIKATASEENLKALSNNSPQILHIATHGFFLPEPDKKKREAGFDQGNTYTLADDPLLRSGLILSGGNYAWSGKTPIEGVEDGIATAYEISQLNLSNTELVVLSACETALGDVKGSEGVFGLQRAFKMAGVKKMIVSLWQVPDKETAELMTAFYSYWMKGKTINDAFAQAQADMRKKYSPFYWAAFVLVE